MQSQYQLEVQSRKTKKPFAYYQKLLTLLLDCLVDGKNYQETADILNLAGVPSASGKIWKAINVQVQVHRLNDANYSGWISDAFARMQAMSLVSAQQLAALRSKKR